MNNPAFFCHLCRVNDNRKPRECGHWLMMAMLFFSATVWAQPAVLAGDVAFSSQGRTGKAVSLDACATLPRFARHLRFVGGLYLSTNLKKRDGLYVMGRLPNGRLARWRDPSWAETGPVSAYARDRRGHIYLAATPFVQAADDAAWRYRTIWKIDSDSGKIAPWLTLPVAGKPHAGNPYGILGMAYDCSTDSLYVTSVMGSDYDHKKGMVYRIDLRTSAVQKVLTGIDAMGVLVMTGAGGKRLLLGSARSSAVLSLPLDHSGQVTGPPRLLFRLQQAPGGRDDRARRLILNNQTGELTIKAMDFDFTLRTASEAEERWYHYRYQPANDQWKFSHVETVNDRLRASGLLPGSDN